jgi:hypothetical protein
LTSVLFLLLLTPALTSICGLLLFFTFPLTSLVSRDSWMSWTRRSTRSQ